MHTITVMHTLYALLSFAISVRAHDLLIFDEFQYTFNLLDPQDWDEHHLTNDYNIHLDTNSDATPFKRRLIREYIETASSNLFASTNTDHASKCTEVIPVIFKQLCVHWDAHKGFKYNYRVPTPIKEHLEDTDWFYKSHTDKMASAKAADQHYGDLLNQANVYLGDDSEWNEINYASTVSTFSLHNQEAHNQFLQNYAQGSFKQCRHSPMLQECTEFHLPSKRLTVKIKAAKERRQPVDVIATKRTARETPANAQAMDETDMEYEDYYDDYYEDEEEGYNYDELMQFFENIMPYDYEREFEYGDARGYHNWAADMMRWDQFECSNCHETQTRRRALDSFYDRYGDYTYLFHDHELDFANDNDWNEVSKEGGMKCSIAIPGFSHKVCVDLTQSKDDAQMSFAAASDADVDYGYYDMYGYDMYYYNIDHLYPHSKQTLARSDAEQAITDEYYSYEDIDTDTDRGYYHDSKSNNDYYHAIKHSDTDVDVNQNGDVTGKDDDGYDYDYYHTHSDNLNNNQDSEDDDDVNNGRLNRDFDADMYDEKADNDDDDNEDENADDDDDQNNRNSDSYRKLSDAQYERQDNRELQRLRARDQQQQQSTMGNNPYNMVNPLQQLQQMVGLNQQRRRLGIMDRDASIGIGAMYSAYNEDDDDYDDDEYYDDDYYDDGYYDDDDAIDAQQQKIDSINEAFVSTLRRELGDTMFNFNDDEMWDDITHVYDADKKRRIRKCASLQTAQLCATTDPAHKTLKTNLKVGKYKFHRSYRPWEQKEADAVEDLTDLLNDNTLVDNDKRAMKNMDKMQNLQQHMDSMQNMNAMNDAWGMDAGVIDVDDDEWNNNDLWSDVQKIPLTATKSHKGIVRKCRGLTFCLCQYLDKKFDGNQKHKCVSYKDHKRLQPHYKLLNVMDEFMSSPLKHMMVGKHNHMNLRVQYHPSIVHLHIMGRHPFFHRHHHLHRYRVPWFRYRKYQHLRPNKRPKWCPRWIWREVNGHLKKPKGFKHNKAARKGSAAQLDETNYYQYDGEMVDRMDEMDDEADSFEDELPYLAPLIRASLSLLPNVYNNARKVLPSVIKKRMSSTGDIGKSLNDRAPEFLGHAGPELRRDIIRSQEDLRGYMRRHSAMEDEDNEYEYNDAYVYDDDEDAYDFDGDDYDEEDDDDDDYDEDEYSDEYYDGTYGVGGGGGMMGMNMRQMYPWQRNIARRNGFNRGMYGMNGFNSYQAPVNSPSARLIRAFQNARMQKIAGIRNYERSKYPQTFPQPRSGVMRRRMRSDYYYYNEEEEEESEADADEDIMDNWFDEQTGMNWVILRDDLNEDMRELESLGKDMTWNLVKADIVSSSGKRLNQRCMNLFGRKVCICQFLAFIDASRASHLCYPSKQPQMKPIVPKRIKAEDLLKGNKRLKKERIVKELETKLSAEPVDHKPEKLNLINGKPLGPGMIKKIEKVNEDKKEKIEKKKSAKLKAKRVLEKAQTNILKAKAQQIRKEVKGQLPTHRPLWLPHYFWHWMHHAPHFHLLRHKRRVPWQPKGQSALKGAKARVDEENVMSGYEAEVDTADMEEYDWLNDDDDYSQYSEFESDSVNEAYDGYTAHDIDMDDEEDYGEYESLNDDDYYYDDDVDDDYSQYGEFESDSVNEAVYDGYTAQDIDMDDEEDYGEYEWMNDGYRQYDEFESESANDGYTAHDIDMDNEDNYVEYDWMNEGYDDDNDAMGEYEEDESEEYEEALQDGQQGWNDAYDDDDDNNEGYEIEDEEDDMNYLQSGNDFTSINGDAGEYGGGFLWMIGLVSFMLFCICAFFMSIGIRRRRRELRRQKAENIYLQQALEMTESESESEFDQEIIE